MKKITRTISLLLAAALAMPVAMHAQDPYDDLYYSPSKAKKEKEEALKKAAAEAAKYNSYPSADTYTSGSVNPLQVDVDAYNRRSSTAGSAEQSSKYEDGFSYTRRIEKYHNADIVSESGDTTLMEYYYNTPSEQDVNVYIINNIDPYDYAWRYSSWPYYNSWRYGYYNYWGPRWSFSWGIDPWFDYSWGWYNPWYDPWYSPGFGWSWTWHPGWHPGHHHGPGHGPSVGPGHNGGWASNSSGASRPHRPGYSIGSSTSRHPGNTSSWNYSGNTNRPGNMGRPSNNSSTRPGNSGYGNNTRPSAPSNNNYGTGSSNNSRRGSSSSSYNSSSSSNSHYSSPSFNRGSSNNGSRGSGMGGGGGYRGGGGGGRGRR